MTNAPRSLGIAKANGGLYRAYLLKEQLRAIFQAVEPTDARALLGGWIAWARRCRLEPFVKLAKTIKKYQFLTLLCVSRGSGGRPSSGRLGRGSLGDRMRSLRCQATRQVGQ